MMNFHNLQNFTILLQFCFALTLKSNPMRYSIGLNVIENIQVLIGYELFWESKKMQRTQKRTYNKKGKTKHQPVYFHHC